MSAKMAIALIGFVTPVCRHLTVVIVQRINRGTQLLTLTAVFLVNSIDGLSSSLKANKLFITLILAPVIGNVARKTFPVLVASDSLLIMAHLSDHVSTVTESVENKLSKSLTHTVGSSIVGDPCH
jgi:Ca2+:H+ antiporter